MCGKNYAARASSATFIEDVTYATVRNHASARFISRAGSSERSHFDAPTDELRFIGGMLSDISPTQMKAAVDRLAQEGAEANIDDFGLHFICPVCGRRNRLADAVRTKMDSFTWSKLTSPSEAAAAPDWNPVRNHYFT